MNDWLKNVVCIYTLKLYLAVENNEIMALVEKYMKLDIIIIIILSEISETQKDK